MSDRWLNRSLVACLVLALMPGAAQAARQATQTAAPDPSLVRVFIQTDDGGHPDELAARQESVKDLAAALASNKKLLAIVDDEEKADVVIEVIGREVTVPKVVLGIGARPGQPPGTNAPARAVALRVELTWSRQSVALVNKNKPLESQRGWRSAAEDLGNQIEKWIAERRAEIVRGRS